MIVDITLMIVGILLLYLGGESLLKGCIDIADTWKLPKIFVSTIIVGFGTSLPELVVSLRAAFAESPDLVLGNIIGSNTSNILLVLGIAVLIGPFTIQKQLISKNVAWLCVSSMLLFIMCMFDAIGFYSGVLLLAVLCFYFIHVFFHNTQASEQVFDHTIADSATGMTFAPWVSYLLCVVGLLSLVGGGHLVVEGASGLARSLAIPEVVVGLSILAVGTSLPELTTAVVAALRKHSDVVVGNILGSNIFNILIVLGLTSCIKSIKVASQIVQIDIWVMLISVFALGYMLLRGRVFSRKVGVFFVIAYFLYVVSIFHAG